jgi:hypothetical protein
LKKRQEDAMNDIDVWISTIRVGLLLFEQYRQILRMSPKPSLINLTLMRNLRNQLAEIADYHGAKLNLLRSFGPPE